jgi:hypothetical protein
VTHLPQFVDHAAFRRISFFTVTRRILYHLEQAFHTGTQERMTIQAFAQQLVTING